MPTWQRPPRKCPTRALAERQNAIGDAACVHQFAGEEEERDGQQREVVQPTDEQLRDEFERRAGPDDEQRQQAGGKDREYQRQAERRQHQQRSDEQRRAPKFRCGRETRAPQMRAMAISHSPHPTGTDQYRIWTETFNATYRSLRVRSMRPNDFHAISASIATHNAARTSRSQRRIAAGTRSMKKSMRMCAPPTAAIMIIQTKISRVSSSLHGTDQLNT